MNICMYICMYTSSMHVACRYACCIHGCMYVRMHVCMYACTHACMYVCTHAHTCMYVCTHACMYVCNQSLFAAYMFVKFIIVRDSIWTCGVIVILVVQRKHFVLLSSCSSLSCSPTVLLPISAVVILVVPFQSLTYLIIIVFVFPLHSFLHTQCSHAFYFISLSPSTVPGIKLRDVRKNQLPFLKICVLRTPV